MAWHGTEAEGKPGLGSSAEKQGRKVRAVSERSREWVPVGVRRGCVQQANQSGQGSK